MTPAYGDLVIILAHCSRALSPWRRIALTLEHEVEQHRNDDPHLRSANAVMHYHIEASDGGIGHVQGLLLDEDTWAIRYLIVNTSNWWLGHNVLIAPQWISGMSWPGRTVSVNLTREAIKGSPPYDSAGSLQRHEEVTLYNHYRREGYWRIV